MYYNLTKSFFSSIYLLCILSMIPQVAVILLSLWTPPQSLCNSQPTHRRGLSYLSYGLLLNRYAKTNQPTDEGYLTYLMDVSSIVMQKPSNPQAMVILLIL